MTQCIKILIYAIVLLIAGCNFLGDRSTVYFDPQTGSGSSGGGSGGSGGGSGSDPAPTVTSVLPVNGSTAGGTVVVLTGTGFLAGATATVGGVNCGSLSVNSATQITCTTGAHVAGVVSLVVTNTDAQTGTLSNLSLIHI